VQRSGYSICRREAIAAASYRLTTAAIAARALGARAACAASATPAICSQRGRFPGRQTSKRRDRWEERPEECLAATVNFLRQVHVVIEVADSFALPATQVDAVLDLRIDAVEDALDAEHSGHALVNVPRRKPEHVIGGSTACAGIRSPLRSMTSGARVASRRGAADALRAGICGP
jgi:hypothetical protein